MMMVAIQFKPSGKEYLFGVPEDYKGKRQIKPGSLVRVPVNGGKRKALFPVVRVVEVDVPPKGLKMIGHPLSQIVHNRTRKKRQAAHQGGIIYLAKKDRAAKRARLGGRPIDLAWAAEKAAWIEDDLDIEPYLAKGYDTDEGLPKLRELRLAMRMGFDESGYDDPTLPLHIIKKRRVHQLRDWAREQGLLPPMYYEDPIHGVTKDQLRELLRDDTILVAVCAVDSELGTIQPIREIAGIVKPYPGCRLHVDATQAVGKTDLWLDGVDTMSFTAHKFYGPNGIGALYKRRGLVIEPQISGGASTTIIRSGTPTLWLAVSLDASLTKALAGQDARNAHVQRKPPSYRCFQYGC